MFVFMVFEFASPCFMCYCSCFLRSLCFTPLICYLGDQFTSFHLPFLIIFCVFKPSVYSGHSIVFVLVWIGCIVFLLWTVFLYEIWLHLDLLTHWLHDPLSHVDCHPTGSARLTCPSCSALDRHHLGFSTNFQASAYSSGLHPFGSIVLRLPSSSTVVLGRFCSSWSS